MLLNKWSLTEISGLFPLLISLRQFLKTTINESDSTEKFLFNIGR